tara:strand:+ start:394 stop:1167 length:774 start_codon:yes stop_codon:yes gene_type:complete
MYSNNGIFDFSLLDKIKQFPSKVFFKDLSDNLSDFNEITKHWITAQDFINLDNQIKFLKTHHIKCKIGKYNFTDKKNTLATIYVVRDPRNLVSSISNHYSKSLKDSKNFLLTPKFISGYKKDGGIDKNSIKTLIGTWKEHYRFWRENNKNFLLIKYEDLINDTNSELIKIINFLKKFVKIETNEIKIRNILNTTNFKYLKNLEREGKFNENAYENIDKKKQFFHLGPNNNWENILEPKIKNEIEEKLSGEMKELGYI